MITHLFSTLALMAGAGIAIQAAMNAHLGNLLKNPLMAAAIAFVFAAFFTLSSVLFSTKSYPEINIIKQIPFYLWFSGGAISAFAVAMFYFLIPKMGAGTMMSYALSGQILVALLCSHFGWFELPVKSITSLKIFGVIALISGMILINWEPLQNA